MKEKILNPAYELNKVVAPNNLDGAFVRLKRVKEYLQTMEQLAQKIKIHLDEIQEIVDQNRG